KVSSSLIPALILLFYKTSFLYLPAKFRGMNTMNGPLRILGIFLLVAVTSLTSRAQGTGEDPIGFKGGYKALSRGGETNVDAPAHLLVNDYSRGYSVSLEIPAGVDTVTNISFLTATAPQLAQEVTLA